MQLFDILFVVILSLAAFCDITVRKIPNWLILSSLLLGIAFKAYLGLTPLYESLTGLVLGVGLFFIPFALGWMGAGDVKFVGVVGCLLGYRWLPRVIFYSALVAGVIALGYLLFNRAGGGLLGFIRSAWGDLKMAILSRGVVLPVRISKTGLAGGSTVPWGVAIAAGALIAYFADPQGRWAGI